MFEKIVALVEEINKTEFQKLIEKLTEFRDRQLKYDESNRIFNGRNSYSKTDIHATFMHMKDDHMRNAQLKPGYNAQIAVSSEYIVGVGIFSDRNDLGTLKPMLENMNECLGKKFKNIVADSGYESEKNYVYLLSNEMTPFIKPQTYEKWKKKSFEKDISKRENMQYDDINDQYTCHNGKILKKIGTTTKTSKTGYEAIVTNYECEDCSDYVYKPKCTKAKGNKHMQVYKNFIAKRAISYENIPSDEGILLRMNRSIQVEGAFGVLKSDYNFTRFFYSWKNNVKTEFIMLCFGYNVNKLHAKIQSEICATHLHQIKKAA
ncbi:transposase [uncultured Clostridium sp.]|uniref:transposase n=1 Tax=uncultured Clostridium sp. TaxID=59620 RepID=UPI0032166892